MRISNNFNLQNSNTLKSTQNQQKVGPEQGEMGKLSQKRLTELAKKSLIPDGKQHKIGPFENFESESILDVCEHIRKLHGEAHLIPDTASDGREVWYIEYTIPQQEMPKSNGNAGVQKSQDNAQLKEINTKAAVLKDASLNKNLSQSGSLQLAQNQNGNKLNRFM